MNILRRILSFVSYLNSFSKHERERKAREEEAAYHYVWVMRLREKEKVLVVQKKMELQTLIEGRNVDVEAANALRKEIDLKESLLNSKVLEIEKTENNSWIIEAYERELSERQAIHLARIEIEQLVREGKLEPEKVQVLMNELKNKEVIMDKFVSRLPSFSMAYQGNLNRRI